MGKVRPEVCHDQLYILFKISIKFFKLFILPTTDTERCRQMMLDLISNIILELNCHNISQTAILIAPYYQTYNDRAVI